MIAKLHRAALWLTFAVWWGGFTFYAAIVVPTGAHLLGGADQGLVTRHVSVWLNWLGVATLALLWPRLKGNRALQIAWVVMAIAQFVQFSLHPRLVAVLDDADRFYGWHRAYLWAAAIQWCAGLCCLWRLCDDRGSGFQPER